MRAIGEISEKIGSISTNILLKILKDDKISPALSSEAVISLTKYLSKQQSEERKKNQLPLVALLTTFLVDLENQEARKVLFYQIMSYTVKPLFLL